MTHVRKGAAAKLSRQESARGRARIHALASAGAQEMSAPGPATSKRKRTKKVVKDAS